MLVGVDICNTIADVNKEIVKYLGPWPTSEYKHPKLYSGFFEEHPDVFSNADPFPGAVEALKRLKSGIVYLSSRPDWAYEISHKWLLDNGFPKGKIILTDKKHKIARHLGIVLVLEDNPSDIINYKREGINVLVKAQPYNMRYGPRFDWKNE